MGNSMGDAAPNPSRAASPHTPILNIQVRQSASPVYKLWLPHVIGKAAQLLVGGESTPTRRLSKRTLLKQPAVTAQGDTSWSCRTGWGCCSRRTLQHTHKLREQRCLQGRAAASIHQ